MTRAAARSHVDRPWIPVLMSRKTLAYTLDVSETTIDDWVARGIIPPGKKIQGNLRWRWSDVEAALSTRFDGDVAGPNNRDTPSPGNKLAKAIKAQEANCGAS